MDTPGKIPEMDTDTSSLELEFSQAAAYFQNQEMPNLQYGDNRYADEDGLLQFICGIKYGGDPAAEN